jgi:hypothetical protein
VPGTREYLIEVPHSPEECPASPVDLPVHDQSKPRAAYSGCRAGTHTTWIIAELKAEEEAWRLVPRLLRDTARVVPVDTCELSSGNPRRGGNTRRR